MTRLRPLDYFQIITTCLFVALGVVIVVRGASAGAGALAYVVGLVFVGLGAHRLRFVLRAFRGRESR